MWLVAICVVVGGMFAAGHFVGLKPKATVAAMATIGVSLVAVAVTIQGLVSITETPAAAWPALQTALLAWILLCFILHLSRGVRT